MLQRISDHLWYARKVLQGAWAGYAGLQWRDRRGHWHDIAPGTCPDRAYYVCVSWRNWTHTPLPVILQWKNTEYPWQTLAVRLLGWLCWPDMLAAIHDCRKYAGPEHVAPATTGPDRNLVDWTALSYER
ncbi:MAG: hypothetical protein KKB13_11025 [Chloroflexi bacterium]|nr:hypothetical protein [Chloroflexota bacterium]